MTYILWNGIERITIQYRITEPFHRKVIFYELFQFSTGHNIRTVKRPQFWLGFLGKFIQLFIERDHESLHT